MDGNGRWARGRGLPRLMGHRAGLNNIEVTTRLVKKFGIRYFSLYAFSTENWSRPPREIEGLMSFFRFFTRRKSQEVINEGGRIRFAGRRDRLPGDLVQLMAETEERSLHGEVFDLILCMDYGGRTELLDAFNALAASGHEGPVTEGALRRHLYLPDVPDPDLIVRTSGELRMSNFWLWESAYSEFYFTEKHWPEFKEEEFVKALEAFTQRKRRYGGLEEKQR
jgi:undecaprenyl diphosphate synthase